MKLPSVLLLGALLAPLAGLAFPRGHALHPWDEDVPAMQALEQTGTVVEGAHVVLLFPKDAVTPAQGAALVARYDRGVADAKALLGRPGWAYRGDPRIYFYFPDGKFVCHAPGGNTVFIPLWRALEDQAPWLHEIMHLLVDAGGGDWLAQPEDVQNARMPLWLHEGLADSLALDVAHRTGLVNFSPLIDAADTARLDELARQQLETPGAALVLDFVGTHGKMPELFTPDRMKVVQPFYTLSASLVRFLVARHGYTPLLRALAAFDHEEEELSRALGRPLAEEKAAWLTYLRAPAVP